MAKEKESLIVRLFSVCLKNQDIQMKDQLNLNVFIKSLSI